MLDLLVIIVNWNGEKVIRECLATTKASVEASAFSIQVVLVDNNSTDNSRSVIDAFEFVTKLYLDENMGFAAANNIALKKYDARYYLLLNPDVIVTDPCNFDKMIHYMDQNKEVGVAGCRLKYGDGTWQPSIGHYSNLTSGFAEQTGLNYIFHQHRILKSIGNELSLLFKNALSHFNEGAHLKNAILDVDFVLGAYMFIRNEVVQQIGYLDETFFIFGEENDFCRRAKKSGFRIQFVPITEIIHLKSQSQLQVFHKMYYWHIAVYFWYFHKHDLTRYVIWSIFTPLVQTILLTSAWFKKNRLRTNIHCSLIKLAFSPAAIPAKMFTYWNQIKVLN